MTKIAIVGHGFVGKAVEYGFDIPENEITIIDPIYDTNVSDIDHISTELIFICAPTPMKQSGEIDSSIIEQIVSEIQEYIGTALVVLKSTVTPDIIEQISNKLGKRFIYNPEFLTERDAKHDFINPRINVIGSTSIESSKMLESFYINNSKCNITVHHSYYTTPVEASFIKYGVNSFLATKVSWFNEFYDVISKYDCNYDTIVNAMCADDRINSSHTSVPGHDGKRGYGGSCFPKDTRALANFSDFRMNVLWEAVCSNNSYRSKYELDDREKEQNVNYDTE